MNAVPLALKVRSRVVGASHLDKDVLAFSDCRRILDVGCGRGDFLEKCGSRGVGIDGSADNVERCLSRGLDAIQRLLPDRLPFETASFDGVYLSHVVEHFASADAASVLAEIDRVLAPGGLMLLRSPLMGPEFFDDPTHIRPYHLHSVLHMLGGWEDPGQRQSIMGREQPHYRLKRYYEETYPLYASRVSPTIAPMRFPLRLAMRGSAQILARIGIGRKGAYGALLQKETG
jgi:SAM-dependent methyltransferase